MENKKYIVTAPFRSKSNYDELWNVGDDVSHLEKDRIERLLSIGCVVEQVIDEPALPEIENQPPVINPSVIEKIDPPVKEITKVAADTAKQDDKGKKV